MLQVLSTCRQYLQLNVIFAQVGQGVLCKLQHACWIPMAIKGQGSCGGDGGSLSDKARKSHYQLTSWHQATQDRVHCQHVVW